MIYPTILAALFDHAARTPEAPCLCWGDTTLSYADVVAQSARWAGWFQQQGTQLGDRIGLFLPNSPTFVCAYLGAQLAGAAVVLINTQYRAHELQHMLADAQPRLTITNEDGQALLAGLTQPVQSYTTDVELPPADLDALALPEPSDLALLAYTSGTTGRAKGAVHTHASLAANSAAVTTAWHWTSADRLLLVLPLFHIHGLGVGVHGTLLTGASLDLRPRFVLEEVLAALASGTISMFFGVPTMYTRMVAALRIEEPGNQGTGAAAVRLFVSGSAPLSAQTFADFQRLFGHTILERYGMTETVMNLTNPYAGERRPGSVGMPFPGQEARIVDVQQRTPLPDGQIGEIQVRGPHVCAGYWQNPAATNAVFHSDGWFSTGDLGMRSADGYYTITGRASDMIISGGYNVYPREVEEVLLQHPAVVECAVFALPDADLGERVAAAIVLDPQAMLSTAAADAELSAFCRNHLAAYKLPRTIVYRDTLPRNALGKVQKPALIAEYR
jgi:malonyl-CoA/methylmalonyl-CoA synthetase